MSTELTELVDRLEKRYGALCVLEMLREGSIIYIERIGKLAESLYEPEGELARRVQEIATSIDPDVSLRFEKTPGGQKITLQGKLGPEAAERFTAEFDALLDGIPGLRAIVPGAECLIERAHLDDGETVK